VSNTGRLIPLQSNIIGEFYFGTSEENSRGIDTSNVTSRATVT
jgi:hypothetical protein